MDLAAAQTEQVGSGRHGTSPATIGLWHRLGFGLSVSDADLMGVSKLSFVVQSPSEFWLIIIHHPPFASHICDPSRIIRLFAHPLCDQEIQGHSRILVPVR